MTDPDPITDRFAEALRIHDNGMIRPLWADAPEHLKAFWLHKAAQMRRTMERRGIGISITTNRLENGHDNACGN